MRRPALIALRLLARAAQAQGCGEVLSVATASAAELRAAFVPPAAQPPVARPWCAATPAPRGCGRRCSTCPWPVPGTDPMQACEGRSPHGFDGQDAEVAEGIARFVRGGAY